MCTPALERRAHPISDRSPRRILGNRALDLLLGASLLLWASADMAVAGSYLARCPAAAGTIGDRLTITPSEPTEPGCVARALPIEAGSVLAVLPAPRRAAGAPEPEVLTIAGAMGKSGFEAREIAVTPASRSAPAPYFVPGEDLRAVSSAGALGPLGRATLDTTGDDIVLDCAPGTERAGLAFA